MLCPKALGDQLGAGDHEEGLPRAQEDTREDALEEAAIAILLNDHLEDLDHVLLGLAPVGSGLHLDTGHLEGVVPAGKGASDNA